MKGQRVAASNSSSPGEERLVLVTDLDGSLLDAETYSFDPARGTLARLHRSGALLVLASSKSGAEMRALAPEIGGNPPLIAENGGAILVPRPDGGYETIALGVPRAELVAAFAEIERETRAGALGFATLDAGAVCALTGLSLEAAARALERDFDEPFLLPDRRGEAAFLEAAKRRGLRVTRGGRFYHLTGPVDKGLALLRLLDERALRAAVGLGDAPNDLPMLRAVSRPIAIPGRDGRIHDALRAALPEAEAAPAQGPAGWSAAVETVLEGGRMPSLVDAVGA